MPVYSQVPHQPRQAFLLFRNCSAVSQVPSVIQEENYLTQFDFPYFAQEIFPGTPVKCTSGSLFNALQKSPRLFIHCFIY